MSPPPYVKHTGTGPILEDLFNERGLPELPSSLSHCEDIKAARSRMIALFSQFDFINKHEAQLAVSMDDSTFKLSTSTRRSWANKLRRQVGPSIVLEGILAGVRALEVATVESKTEILEDFIMPLQKTIKAVLNNEAVKDLLRPYTLGVADQHAIRKVTKNAALPSFQAALRTNKFGLECSFDAIMSSKEEDLVDLLNLALLQWTTIRNFKVWVESKGSKNFSMVTLDVLQKHVVMIEGCLKHMENMKIENQKA